MDMLHEHAACINPDVTGDAPGLIQDDAARFFSLLYPPGSPGHLVLFTLPGSRSCWLPAADGNAAATRAKEIAAQRLNVYFGIGLQDQEAAQRLGKPGTRGTNATVLALPGLFADIDIKSPAHKSESLPSTLEEAMTLVRDFPLEPTILVWSGHGLQVYWLFRALWTFVGEADQGAAAILQKRFIATLQAHAKKRGWTVDPTSDLARIFRVPGTVNIKQDCEPVQVETQWEDAAARYQVADFEPHLIALAEPELKPERQLHTVPKESPAAAQNGTSQARGMGFQGTDEELIAKAQQAQNGEKFTALWQGDTSASPSQSEADLALCNLLAFWCGPDPARIDGLFRQSGLMRDKWDEARGDQTYAEITIEKAIAGTSPVYSPLIPDHVLTKGGQPPVATPANGNHPADTDPFLKTDLGNSERLIQQRKDQLLWCDPWRKWLTWDKTRWLVDSSQRVRRWAKEAVRAMYAEAAAIEDRVQREALSRWAVSSESRHRLDAMVSLAQSDVPILPEELDRNPWLLNCLNGTLNLKTGQLQTHNAADRITKCVPVAYDTEAACPTWEAFLADIFQGNQELIHYIWRALGYSLTGCTTEQCFFLLHGAGENGKSTFLECVQRLLADYGESASPSTFLHQDRETVRNDIAKLRSARFVAAVETDDGKRLSEVMIKQMTGGDAITARFLFAEYFTFNPEFKIWLGTNHKPEIRGTDHAIWRRVRLIPFDWTVPAEQRDNGFATKLDAELPGILAWCVRGCLAWQAEGLEPPEIVQAATAEYRSEQDLLGAFLDECCILRPKITAPASDLYQAYAKWCEDNGEMTQTQHRFGRQLRERGLQNGRSSATGRKIWDGIGLKV